MEFHRAKTYIILPAYNEEECIEKLLLRITNSFIEMNDSSNDFCVVAVNDGSKDSTLSILNRMKDQMPLVVLDHGINKGLGEAIKTGFKY